MWTRNFSRLWLSEAFSLVGSQLTAFALPIIAIQVLAATAGEVALINTAAGLGTLVFAVLFAHWTDSPHRRRIMIGLNVARMVVVLTLVGSLAASVPSYWALAAAALLLAGFTATYDSVFAAVMPLTVHPAGLTRANAWVGGIRSVANIGAGGAAGVLLQAFGPVALLLADAVTYAAAAIGVSGIDVPQPVRRTVGLRSYFASVVSGFSFLWHEGILRTVTMSIAHFNFFTTGVQALYVTYLLRNADITPAELGLGAALGGVIGMLGVVIGPRLLDRCRLGPLLGLTFAVPSLSVVGFLFVQTSGPLSGVLLLAVALGLWSTSVLVNITVTESLKQALVPNEMIGRYSSASRVITWGMDPLGAAFAGLLTLFMSVGGSLVVLAVGVATSFLWIAISTHTRTLPKFMHLRSARVSEQRVTSADG